MKQVIDGHARFLDAVYPQKKALFEALGSGQKPHTLFISCSDSRVDPALFTSMDPGELFVIRNAGNIVPAHGADEGATSAAIEYCLAALPIENVIVCGHSGCGAMGAVLHPETLDELPRVEAWIDHAASARAALDAEGTEGEAERLKRCVELNVLAQIDNLVTHPSVAARLAKKSLKIYGWVFDIATAQVKAYDPSRKAFVDLDAGAADFVVRG